LLVDRNTLAQQLGCSLSHIDHMRKRGMPELKVGEVVRFEPQAVLDWIRKHQNESSE
jgi:phage terminase Nu1 subunit (DNA packaging protein)